MILFVYGLFGFVYLIITAPILIIGPCNANIESSSGSDPPQEAIKAEQHQPLGFGPSMDKL